MLMDDHADVSTVVDHDVSIAGKPRRKKKRTPRTLATYARVPRYADIGPMPTDDPLAMNQWLHKALGVSAAQTVWDPDLKESERRSMLCEIAGRMASLTPQSRMYGAESLIRGEAAGLDAGQGPEMEKVSDGAQVTVSPATGRSTTRRGRPRKRSLL